MFGPDDGETVLLLHGWTETLPFWVYVTEELTRRGFRVVAMDLRGHGESQPAAAGEYALARFGDDVEAMLDATLADGERAIIAGHSLGGMSIAAWAERHDVRRRARGAAMINTGLGDLLAEQLLIPVPAIARTISDAIAVRGLLGSRAPLPRFSTPASYALVRYTAFGPTATPAQIAFYERMLWTCPPRVRADVGIALSEMDLFGAVERLLVPTVVVAGERDRLTPPSHGKRIAELVPDSAGLIVLATPVTWGRSSAHTRSATRSRRSGPRPPRGRDAAGASATPPPPRPDRHPPTAARIASRGLVAPPAGLLSPN